MKIITKARMRKMTTRLLIELKNSLGAIKIHLHSINLKGLIKNCLFIVVKDRTFLSIDSDLDNREARSLQ
jgi:hypothetical protein